MNTPWGIADNIKPICGGIEFVSTPSHGGYKVSKELWYSMPAYARETPYSEGGWFEEDTDWALVCVSLPHLFDRDKVLDAQKVIERTYPQLMGKFQADNLWIFLD